eukprot:CAMPEP_0174836338 /NCGR_PEP_ID=MMETSP1114-20130205/5999_1 /TAXON_ID=312471 /ORGANISM="Neobodo designis, Strain CCAP 1951/1" /LENGTH=243 /DNA_ID=CAMNT_0016070325 /DNA_START=45 /DNA_END=773 /DNA_ORIENTATION=-
MAAVPDQASGTTTQVTHSAQPDFVNEVPALLACAICFGAAIIAFVTEDCGHLYCHDCILRALAKKKECPYCRDPLTDKGIRKSVRAQREIMALTVNCGNKAHGCEWKGELAELDRHMERCQHAKIKCPFSTHGCDEVCHRNAVREHMATCPVMLRLEIGDAALLHDMAIRQRANGGQFVWKIPDMPSRRDHMRSSNFMAHGLKWFVRHEVEPQPGVFVNRMGHNKRARFTLTIFNTNQDNDLV